MFGIYPSVFKAAQAKLSQSVDDPLPLDDA